MATKSKQTDKKQLKPTVTLVLTIDEPITKKALAEHIKGLFSGGYRHENWLIPHLQNVRVRSIDFD